MNIPPEFADYMVTESYLNHQDQYKRFVDMHTLEIRERTRILKSLDYDKETVKRRIKKYIECGFDFFDLPEFYRAVDSIVDEVYSRP